MEHLIVERRYSIVTNYTTRNTLLHNACRDMNIEKLKFLIEECRVNPQSAVNKFGDTLIHAFSSSAWQPIDFNILSFLCDRGSDSFQCNAFSHNPLEVAIISEHKKSTVSIVRYLAKRFSRYATMLKTTNSHVLEMVYQHWNDELIKYLIVDIGCDIMLPSGDTLLHRACR